MAKTTFVDKVTHLVASWLNPVNLATYDAIGDGTNAPTTHAQVRTNIGLAATTAPTGASLIGTSGTYSDVQTFITVIESIGGALIVGTQPTGDLTAATVQAQLTELDQEKARKAGGNSWTGVAGVGEQLLEYTTPATSGLGDHGGWTALVHNQTGSGNDNLTALTGHGYHDGAYNSSGGVWGVVTESWSNPAGSAVLIGSEFAVIAQYPSGTGVTSLGVNSVFKNRSDTATHPTAPVADGPLYNKNSWAIFTSSQQRPSGAGAAWGSVGSGWNVILRVGDQSTSGLDWEGGDYYPGSSVYRAYSTIIDMTHALTDMAGGFPWHTLYRNNQTYWGMRFNGTLTGQLDTYNIKVNAGGSGYAIADRGTITGGSGSGATYYVKAVAAGVCTEIAIILGGSGYVVSAAAASTATTGGGSGLTIGIAIATGLIFGAHLGVTAGGTGYAVNDLVNLNGGTAGYIKPVLKVTTVSGGVVTGFELQTQELIAPNAVRVYTNGTGHTVGSGKTTTTITGVGSGLTVNISYVHTDLLIGGEKWEYWRMLNPSNPTASGARQGFIDASFPGTPITIDTSGATYQFPIDRPL